VECQKFASGKLQAYTAFFLPERVFDIFDRVEEIKWGQNCLFRVEYVPERYLFAID
jgi:hypothetical protein